MSGQGPGLSRASLKRKKKHSSKPITENENHNKLARPKMHANEINSSAVLTVENEIVEDNYLIDISSIDDVIVLSESNKHSYPDIAKSLLNYIISPSSLNEFYDSYWQKSIYHGSTPLSNRFRGIYSRKQVEKLCKSHLLYLEKDIVFSSTSNGIEINDDDSNDSDDNHDQHNDNNIEEEGEEEKENLKEIYASEIWKQYNQGFSIQLNRPQIYEDNLWKILSLIEIEFEAVVGSHIVMSPLNGKGFGRRVSFGDFFILQLHGNTYWSIYTAAAADTTSSSSSSSSSSAITTTDNNEGHSVEKVSTNILLEQGHMLYIPKNTIYDEVSTLEGTSTTDTTTNSTTAVTTSKNGNSTATNKVNKSKSNNNKMKEKKNDDDDDDDDDDYSMYVIIYTNENDSMKSMLESMLPLALQETLNKLLNPINYDSNSKEELSGSSSSSSGYGSGTMNTYGNTAHSSYLYSHDTTTSINSLQSPSHSITTSSSSSNTNHQSHHPNNTINSTKKISKIQQISRILPTHSFSYLGVAHSELEDHCKRNHFTTMLQSVLNQVINKAMDMKDAAVDQIKKQFIIDRLPISLSPLEDKFSHSSFTSAILMPYSQVCIIRPHIACAVVEDNKVIVYHCLDNSREIYSSMNSPLEFEIDDGPAIEELLYSYPHGITVSDLTHNSEELEEKISIAQSLYKEGLLLILDDTTRSTHPDGYETNTHHDGEDKDDDDDIF